MTRLCDCVLFHLSMWADTTVSVAAAVAVVAFDSQIIGETPFYYVVIYRRGHAPCATTSSLPTIHGISVSCTIPLCVPECEKQWFGFSAARTHSSVVTEDLCFQPCTALALDTWRSQP